MHHSGPFHLAVKSPKQDFGGKNCQNASQGKPCKGSCQLLVKVFVQELVNYYEN